MDKLRRLHLADDIALYFDNLSVHRSKVTQERMEELSIPCIFNPVYSPDYNPIENVFAYAKLNFRKLRMEQLLKNEKECIRKNILKSFELVCKYDI